MNLSVEDRLRILEVVEDFALDLFLEEMANCLDAGTKQEMNEDILELEHRVNARLAVVGKLLRVPVSKFDAIEEKHPDCLPMGDRGYTIIKCVILDDPRRE